MERTDTRGGQRRVNAATTRGDEYVLLAATSGGVILAPLNSTMLVVALPSIQDQFGLGHVALGWLVSAYLITMAVAQPLGGQLGDHIGRRRLFRLGLVGFLIASISAALAPTYPLLLAFRLAQAAAGALLIPNARAMLREAVPVLRLGRVNGINAATTLVAAATGPLIGAWLLTAFSWRALFAVNVPLVLTALAIERTLHYRDRVRPGGPTVDWAGTALFAALFALVTQLLSSLRASHMAATAAVAAITVAVGAIFTRQQFRIRAPAVGWDLLVHRPFIAATTHILVTNLVMYTTLLAVPFFIAEVQQRGAGTAGLLLGGMSGLMAVLAPVSGWLADVRGRRMPVLAGSAIALLAAALLFVGLSPTVSTSYLAAALALLGVGVGLGNASATAAIEAAPIARAGTAAGTSSTMRYAGSIVGAGVLSGVLAEGSGGAPGVDVFRIVFGVIAVGARTRARRGRIRPAVPARAGARRPLNRAVERRGTSGVSTDARRATIPPWTPLFGVAAAIVSDTGGPIPHSAIVVAFGVPLSLIGALVAREHGLPCVAGTQVATRPRALPVDGDGAARAVDGHHRTVRDCFGRDVRPDHTRDPVLARDDRGVRQRAATAGDHRARDGEEARPGRGGRAGNQHFAGLQTAAVGEIGDHPRAPIRHAAAGGNATNDAPIGGETIGRRRELACAL